MNPKRKKSLVYPGQQRELTQAPGTQTHIRRKGRRTVALLSVVVFCGVGVGLMGGGLNRGVDQCRWHHTTSMFSLVQLDIIVYIF